MNAITLRFNPRSGDLGAVVSLHGILYARECGFDATFEAYVAGPLADFVQKGSKRERLWLAEDDGQLVGSIAIVAASDSLAQLRWFLLDPEVRGCGLGRRLLHNAIDFAKQSGYAAVTLWTVRSLTAAAKLYRSTGFALIEERPPTKQWGVDVIEQRYEMTFDSRGGKSDE